MDKPSWQYDTRPLFLPENEFRFLYDKFGPSLGFWRAAEIAALREQTFVPPILDLGAGDGIVTSRALAHVDIAIDPDAAALEHAKGLGLYDRFVALPMEDVGLPAGSIGTVLSNSVLEHVVHIDEALQAVARVLKPGGQLIFTTPTEAFSRWLALPGKSYAARRNRHFIHLNLWPVEAWARRLAAVGLELECVRPYLGRGWVRAWDWMELLQIIYLGAGPRRVQVFGRVWRRLPPRWLDALSSRSAKVNLSAPAPGGGRLVVARKR